MRTVKVAASSMTMMKIVADSNVVLSAVLDWHPLNPRALPVIQHALANDQVLLPQRVILESYSVMTRFPSPLRVAPYAAYDLLYGTFGSCRVISSRDVWEFLEQRDHRTAGGRIYDADIAVTAIEAGAQRLLTFNPKHPAPFAGQIEIVVPA